MSSRTLVCGDLHGRFGHLNTIINKKAPDFVFVAGDYGWYPEDDGKRLTKRYGVGGITSTRKEWNLLGIKNGNTKVYWCRGNHEDIRYLPKTNKEVQPGVYYMQDGGALHLPDGRNVLFLGGAKSCEDYRNRPEDEKLWFPEEILTERVLRFLPPVRIDVVISHTCPEEFVDSIPTEHNTEPDPSRLVLSKVLDIYKPSLWCFGHFHETASGEFEGTKWQCLNMSKFTGWFSWI